MRPSLRAEAVALYRSRPGATIASIADDLGVNRETLRNWVRLDDERRGGGPRPGRPVVAAGEAVGAVGAGERRVAAPGSRRR
ncbi:transposase [Krasilnikovia cinnamomea]|uniref:transposase n=1 Tax=Krasilnikovia cinnamomea TaxID=349313 RepID=UPI001A927336|nr:transposase [Krasilnikovia cinnamomea]